MDVARDSNGDNLSANQHGGVEFCCSDNVVIHLSKNDCDRCGTIKTMLLNTSDDDNSVISIIKSSSDMKLLKDWLADGCLPTTMDLLLQLLVVADFLDVQELINLICKKMFEILKDKTPSQLKAVFELEEAKKSSLKFEIEPFDGKDHNLKINSKECYNLGCENPGVEKLLLCTGCHQMKYCSKECQKEDWETHKEPCKNIKKAVKKMNKERLNLIAEEGEDIFRGDNIGHFWGLFEPRNYCRARMQLADEYLQLAHDEEHEHMYEEGLKHYIELMRLIHGDNMGLRYKTPFILINMNRDEDCYNFLKWWLTIDPDGTYDWGNPPPSSEGDWLWLTEQDRFEDPAVLFPGKYGDLAFAVAMLILKLRIVEKHRANIKRFRSVSDYMKKDERWNMLMGVNDLMKIHFVGDRSHFAVMEEQFKHVDFLFNKISKLNPIFLKSVLDPEPLRSQPYPNSYSMGSAEEAWLVLNDSCRIFHRMPGTIMRIRAFFDGADTSYDPKYRNIGW